MKKINYLIGFDTETCNMYDDEKGKLCLDDSLVYDIGWQVTDRAGNVYRKRSYVVEEIFNQCSEIVAVTYFADKIPQYIEDIKTGKRKLASIWEIRSTLLRDMCEFNVEAIFAHNACFDINALNKTIRYITSSRMRYFFNYETNIWDTLKMSRQVILPKRSYQTFCEKNGFMTKHRTPRPQTKAQTIYAYITNNPTFEESHTGLEDVEIETEILAYCFKQHKKMEKELYPDRKLNIQTY